jgi:hypothetical protein
VFLQPKRLLTGKQTHQPRCLRQRQQLWQVKRCQKVVDKFVGKGSKVSQPCWARIIRLKTHDDKRTAVAAQDACRKLQEGLLSWRAQPCRPPAPRLGCFPLPPLIALLCCCPDAMDLT